MNPLELTGTELKQVLERVSARLCTFLDSLPDQPAWNISGAEEVARSVNKLLPVNARELDSVLDELFERLIPVAYNTASPGYFAYIPGGGLPQSGVADLIAAITNRYSTVWTAAPGAAQIESVVVRWFCGMVGYPESAGGFLTTGGSLANWSALTTARRTRLPDNFLNATVYTSDQAHHSIHKAALLAGFPVENVRSIEADADFRVCTKRLRAKIQEDREQGLRPFAVVGHAGTTNTGAIDDLEQLADLCDKEELWFHIDAAYGGFFAMTERGRLRMRGLDRADSITLDPHKGLFLPYGTGCLLVRDQQLLKIAHHVDGDYMPPMQTDNEFIDFCSISPELSRDWRGLRVWLPLQLHGSRAFQAALDEKLDLAEWATDQLRHLSLGPGDRIEIVAEPQLSLVAFRLLRDGVSGRALDQLNQELLEEINSSRRVFLTPTTLGGRFVIRICVLSFRTHLDRMQECIDEIQKALSALRES
jgi:aromatic-L-amino-acid decarboxylase